MDRMEFMVQGSEDEPYRVTLEREGTNLNAYCTCAAGANGQYCKHRFRILSGNPDGIIAPDFDALREAVDWLPGTDVETALRGLIAVEDVLIVAKRELAKATSFQARLKAEDRLGAIKDALAKARKLLAQSLLK